MELRLTGATELEAAALTEPGMDVVGDADGEGFGPLQMFAASMALCTASVMHAYAHNVLSVGVERLAIRVRWSYGQNPNRVDRMEMTILWPDVPDDRLEAARRAAATCTIHRTLEHPPEVVTNIERTDASAR